MRADDRDEVTVEIAYAVLPSVVLVVLVGAALLGLRHGLGLDSAGANWAGAGVFALAVAYGVLRSLTILLRAGRRR